MIKNAIYCFDNTMIIWNLISQSRGIHKMMWFNWFDWSRAAGAKPYLNIACVLFMLFFAEMSYVRCCADVLTTTARSTGDMICLRTSFMHISERALCLINLIWRYYWTMSLWAIDFGDIEKRNLNAFIGHRMNSNRSKTAYSRFCRIACCLIDLFDVNMINFFLLWNFS